VRADSAVEVDGRLDEAAWETRASSPISPSTRPPGRATPYRTEVRLLVDRENLYIGIHCYDPEPAKISSPLDAARHRGPFRRRLRHRRLRHLREQRTGYWFEVHATGSMSDGLIPGPGLYT